MTQRHRQEAATLQKLLECDLRLAGQVAPLRAMLDRRDGVWMVEKRAEIEERLQAIETSLRARQAALLV